MKRETIAIHGGFDSDPTTKAVAVPIYQTAAYSFDSAEHGAALFNLEVPGFRYTRISNPTNEVLEQRVTELEGGVGALSVASGQTALFYASMNALEAGRNLITVPQLYGTTYTLFAHVLPKMGIQVRFAKSDRAADLEALIDDDTRAIFCETVGNPAGNVCDLEALATLAHRHRMPLIVDNTVATPMLVRPVEYGADIVIHSLTKFMGGHGTTLGGIIVDCGRFPWTAHAARYPMFTQPDESYHGLVYTDHYGAAAFIGRCRSVYQRTMGAVLSPMNAFLLLQGIETVALRVDRHVENARKVAEFLRADTRVEVGELCGVCRQSVSSPGAKISGRQGLFADDLRNTRRPRRRHAFLQRAEVVQALGQFGRREIARLPSGVDDASADVRRRTTGRRGRARQYPPQHRDRAHRRHSRRFGPSTRRRGLNSKSLPAAVPALFPSPADRERISNWLTLELAAAHRRVQGGPVTPSIDMQQLRAELAAFDFEQPQPLEEALRWTIERLEHGIVQMSSPRYFGLFNPGANFPAQCADRLAGSFNPQLASSASSPVPRPSSAGPTSSTSAPASPGRSTTCSPTRWARFGIQIQAARLVLHKDADQASDLLAAAQLMAAEGLVETRRAVRPCAPTPCRSMRNSP